MSKKQVWSLTGVAPEAQALAQEAAEREGITLAEWLQRRLLKGDDGRPAAAPKGEPASGEKPNGSREANAPRRRTQSATPSQPEAEITGGRIDDAVLAMARLLESNQRSQTDTSRAIGSLVSEINAAAQDQSAAFQELSGRIERLERKPEAAALHDSVRSLGQNLSKVAEQTQREVAEAVGRIGGLARNVETMDEKVASARSESQRLTLFVQEQLSYFAERVRATESGVARLPQVENALEDLANETRRFEQIEGTIAELEKFGAKAADEIATLSGALEVLANQAGAARDETGSLAERIRANEIRTSGYSRLDDNVASLRNRVGELDGIEESVGRLADRGGAAMARIDSLAGTLDTLSSEFASARDASLRLENHVREQVRQLADRMRSVESATANLDKVEASVEQLSKRMVSLEQVEESIRELHQRDAAAGADIAALNKGLQTAGAKLVTAREDSDKLAMRLGTAEAALATYPDVRDSVASLNRRATELDARDAAAAADIAALDHTLHAAVSKIDSAREDTDKLAERMRTAETVFATYPEIQDKIEGLNRRATALDARDASAAADIAALDHTLQTAVAKIERAREESNNLSTRLKAAETVIATYPEIEASVGKLNTSVAGLDRIQGAVAALGRREVDTSGRVDALAGDFRAFSEKLSVESEHVSEKLRAAEEKTASYARVEQTVDALGSRIAALDEIEKSLAGLGKREADTSGRVDSLTGDIQALSEMLSSETEQVSERLRTAEDKVAAYARVEEAVDALALRVAALDEIEGAIAAFSRHEADTSGRIDALTGRIETLASQAAVSRAEAEKLAARLRIPEESATAQAGYEAALEALKSRVEELSAIEGSLSHLGERNEEVAHQLDALAGEFESFTGRMAGTTVNLTERLHSVEERALSHSAADNVVADPDKRIALREQIEKFVAEYEGREAKTKRLIGTLTGNLEILAADFASLRKESTELAGRLNSAEPAMASSPAAQETIAALSARIEALEHIAGNKPSAAAVQGQESNATPHDISRLEQLLHETMNANREMLIEFRAGLRAMESRVSALEGRGEAVLAPAEPPVLRDAEPRSEVAVPQTQVVPYREAGDFLPNEPIRSPYEEDRPPVAAQDLEPELEPSDILTESPVAITAPEYLERARKAALSAAEQAKPEHRPVVNYDAKAWISGGEGRNGRSQSLVGVAAGLLIAVAAGVYFFNSRGTTPAADISAQPAPVAVSAAQAPQTSSTIEDYLARANLGDSGAMLALSMAYSSGTGVERNDGTAAQWLTRAAQGGAAVAQFQLGVAYEKGIGVAADGKESVRWYTEAAQRGNAKSMYNLGVSYANGSGVEKNLAEAARWFAAAAEFGLTDAQFNLAVLYEHGLGVTTSLVDAYKWYTIAASGGDPDSKARTEAIATQLPAAQKETADRDAASFRAKPVDPVANDLPAPAGASAGVP